jgi:hypothetical protein
VSADNAGAGPLEPQHAAAFPDDAAGGQSSGRRRRYRSKSLKGSARPELAPKQRHQKRRSADSARPVVQRRVHASSSSAAAGSSSLISSSLISSSASPSLGEWQSNANDSPTRRTTKKQRSPVGSRRTAAASLFGFGDQFPAPLFPEQHGGANGGFGAVAVSDDAISPPSSSTTTTTSASLVSDIDPFAQALAMGPRQEFGVGQAASISTSLPSLNENDLDEPLHLNNMRFEPIVYEPSRLLAPSSPFGANNDHHASHRRTRSSNFPF